MLGKSWWDREWEKTSHQLRGHIRIGANTWIGLDEFLHAVIIGPSGMGKSKFLEFLARQLMTHPRRPAIIFLDPAGDSYHELLNFVVAHDLQDRTILFDSEEDQKIIGYDPMSKTASIAYKAQAQVQATLKALGVKEMDSVLLMPQLKLIFFNLYSALMESGLSLAESEYLLSFEDEVLRGAIVERLETESVKKFWKVISQLKFSQRQERLSLAQARIHPFLANDSIRRILSQKRHGLDFDRLIDRGQILLVNLQPRAITAEDQRLLGTLLIQDAIDATFSRRKEERRDLFLIADEFQDLIPPSTGQIMRAGRKYRLHLILATTSLEDLKESHPTLYHQIWTNPPIKILFGDLPEEQLESLAKELYLEELNLKQKKLELHRTFFEPIESERTIETQSWGKGSGHGTSSGASFISDELLGKTVEHEGESSSFSEMEGGSRTEVPFYEFDKQQELSSVQYWTIEEQLHKAKAKLKSLGPREIVIKQRGKGLKFDEVPKLQTIQLPDEVLQEAKQQIYNQPCYATIQEIESERQRRIAELKADNVVVE